MDLRVNANGFLSQIQTFRKSAPNQPLTLITPNVCSADGVDGSCITRRFNAP